MNNIPYNLIQRKVISGGNECVEVQFKMSMILPTKIYATKGNLQKFFEDTVAIEMAWIHYENVELEAIGRTSGFILTEGSTAFTEFHLF